jgi:hypothetical protein
MLVVRTGSWRACWLLLPALLAGVLVVFWTGQRRDHPASPVVPLHDWDISRLVAASLAEHFFPASSEWVGALLRSTRIGPPHSRT